jgi:hypothetical protein
MDHQTVGDMLEVLEDLKIRMTDSELRELAEWKARLEAQDPFDRQDLTDIKQLLEDRG